MMKIESFQYIQNQGWSIPTFPELDSENTLILVLPAPSLGQTANQLKNWLKPIKNQKS